jgi:hypothetical protein
MAVDSRYGQGTDAWKVLRSLGVEAAANVLYRAAIDENPGIPGQFAISAAAGYINYQFCLKDAVDQCRVDNRRLAQNTRDAYIGCTRRLAEYDRAKYFLDKYGPPANARQLYFSKLARINELGNATLFNPRPAAKRVLRCS